MTGATQRSAAQPASRIDLVDGPIEPGTFLEKRSYRRRRRTDGLRLLPLLGLWLFMVPLLWTGSGDLSSKAPVTMSSALIYIFGIWCGLTVLCAALSLVQSWDEGRDGRAPARGGR